MNCNLLMRSLKSLASIVFQNRKSLKPTNTVYFVNLRYSCINRCLILSKRYKLLLQHTLLSVTDNGSSKMCMRRSKKDSPHLNIFCLGSLLN